MASKGVKIALIGCGAIGLIFLVAVLAGGYFVKNWFSDKAKSITKVADTEKEYDQRTTELKQDYPFVAPTNGVITETQLSRFLTVRKSMYDVYKKYEPEFKKMEENKEQGFSVLMKATDLIQGVKMAQLKALEDQRMSPDEYSYIVGAVYKSWFAKGAKDSLQQQQSYSEATQESSRQSIAELDKKIQDPNTTEQEKQILIQTKQMLETQMKTLQPGVQQLDTEIQSVPKENIELFTKHQQEIQQYSMAGLEFIGL